MVSNARCINHAIEELCHFNSPMLTFIHGILKLSHLFSTSTPQRERGEPFLYTLRERHFAGGLMIRVPRPTFLACTLYRM